MWMLGGGVAVDAVVVDWRCRKRRTKAKSAVFGEFRAIFNAAALVVLVFRYVYESRVCVCVCLHRGELFLVVFSAVPCRRFISSDSGREVGGARLVTLKICKAQLMDGAWDGLRTTGYPAIMSVHVHAYICLAVSCGQSATQSLLLVNEPTTLRFFFLHMHKQKNARRKLKSESAV